MNITSSDNSILINDLSLCDFDLKINPSFLNFNLSKQDTNSISILGTGTPLSKLSASVKISTNPQNKLSVDTSGLVVLVDPVNVTDQFVKVSSSDTSGGYLIDKLIAGDIITLTQQNTSFNESLLISLDQDVLSTIIGNIINTSSVKETPLTVNDSATIDFSVSGTSNHTLTASVRVDPSSTNMLSAISGLYVPKLIITDSTTIDLTQSGTYGNILTASAKISTIAGNALVDNNGLYVPPSTSSQTPLTVNDSTTIDLTANGTDSHTLTASAKISSLTGNALVDSTGLFVQSKTIQNGLHETSNNVRLGGALIENSLITGSYDLGLGNRKLVVGNLYTDVYGDSSAAANTRSLYVRNAGTLNSEGNGSLNAYYNLSLTGTGAFGSGRGYVSADHGLRISTSADTNVPNSSIIAANYNVLQLYNSAAGNITVPSNRPIACTTSAVLPISGYSGNSGKVAHVASFYATPVFQESGGHDYTEITNYYGLYLSASDEAVIDGSKLINKFGINQVGVNDANIFRGNISYYGTLTNASDARIKTNINNYDKGLDVINSIRVVDFDYTTKYQRENNVKQIGVIAQELEAVLPEAIQIIDNGDIEDFRTVNQSVLIFALINAVKQLSKEVDELKNK